MRPVFYLALMCLAILFGCDSGLKTENAALKRQIAELEAKLPKEPKPDEMTKEKCTLEYATEHTKKYKPEVYASIQRYVAEDEQAYQDRVAAYEMLTMIKQAVDNTVPEELGAAPKLEIDFAPPDAEVYEYFDSVKKTCELGYGSTAKSAAAAAKSRVQVVHVDWNVFAAHVAKGWNAYVLASVGEMRDESAQSTAEDRGTGRALVMGENIVPGSVTDKVRLVNQLVASLKKGGPALQWLVGRALDFKVNTPYFQARLKSIYAASKTNFVELDQGEQKAAGVAAANNVEIAPEYNFGEIWVTGAMVTTGQYYKGLLLRRWREHEAEGKGQGDAWIKDFQKVLKGVAAGMKIDLEQPVASTR